ncbi:splicing factor U2af large subunit B-like isoform X2 [Macadamia integrifolia]|uniref:splicing factor U2af large subunit B-like isoform X2 n=1 Tax=Macadamia integrifolia TaxID=60698 RepID=UPI001C4F5494|nr:splicing factor U2af large subunit B-like isoform X2 [Macadamia integrifolia]
MLEKMSRINRHKEKYGTGNGLSMDKSEEGTAARTRPFSFEEIMLGRKKKKLVADAEDRAGEPGKLSGKNNVKSVADYSESDGGYKQTLNVKKHVSEDKKTSKKKDEDASRKEDNLLKIKGKEIHNIDANLKVKSNKDSTSRTKSDNSEKRSRHISRNDDRSRGDFENESEKMHLKETMGKDKYVDRDRGKSEREAKRKHQNGEDEESRLEITGNDGKKRDSGKWHDSEYSEKRARKESSQSHYEEMRLKRRSARTREHDRDKDRRSHSVSPRAHRHTSYHAQDFGETSFRSFRDRSARQHSDVDRYRISSNGEHSSSHYRRHGGNSSGLGGYSPRKRRTEAAVKTPSPTPRSPDRKNLGWDHRPAGMDNISSTSVLTNFQPPDQTTSSNSQDLPSASLVISNVTKLLSGASQNAISIIKNVPLDSVQLTQATRPLRRLYLENVAASASEKDLMECLNDFLLSMGINHLQVTKPCISCIINKEKGQAVVEFLTPEDATSALSFDGRSFFGSILKIRRPKDFVEPATGAPEKPVASADAMPITDAIPDIINDSPHKIFVGGIPRALSANMFMEIASSFGHLKAYRFQVDEDLNEPVSFLEYVDQSVTLKACAGISGMMLGGQVLTAVQAFPCASREENGDHTKRPQFYGIPEHAKPLLEMPTKVLKLKNVFKPEDLSSLSGLELEETLEDIRFGTVKSVNIVRNNSASEKAAVTVEVDTKGTCQYPEADDGTNKKEMIEGDIDLNSGVNISVEPPVNDKELQEGGNAGNNCTSEDKPAASDSVESTSSEPVQLDGNNKAFVETPCQMDTDGTSQEAPNQLDMVKHQSQYNDKSADVKAMESGPGNDLVVEEELGPDEATSDKFQELSIGLNDDVAMETGNLEEGDKQKASDLDDVFEHGSIFVEYLRAEASCMAAHCLRGRLYGDQVVEVGYISHDLYLARFTK